MHWKFRLICQLFIPLAPSSVFLSVFLFKSWFLRVLCSQKWDLLMIFLLVWIWQAFCKSFEFDKHSAKVFFFFFFSVSSCYSFIVILLVLVSLFYWYWCSYLYIFIFSFQQHAQSIGRFLFQSCRRKKFWLSNANFLFFFVLFIHYFIHFIPGFKWKLYKLCLLPCNAGEIKPTVNT